MKKLPSWMPPLTLLSALFMFFINISDYKSHAWTWVSVSLSLGALLTIVAYVLMILKSEHSFWMQLLGVLLSLTFVLPQFFKVFYALMKGHQEYLFSFLTISILILLQAILSYKSYLYLNQNFGKKNQEQ